MSYILRKAIASEASEIVSLYHAASEAPFSSWDEDYPGEPEIRQDLSTDSLYVFCGDDRILGTVSILPEDELSDLPCWSRYDGAVEISRVALHPQVQGQGLSSLLLDRVIEKLRNGHASAIHLAVAKNNLPAYRSYLSKGFSAVGEMNRWGHDFFLCELFL